MTLYIHTELSKINQYTVTWATGTSSVGGRMIINFQKNITEQRALAEIYALNILLERYPGKASSTETSQGSLKKLLKGANRFATTEMAFLEIKHRSLSINSHKKTAQRATEYFSLVKQPIVEKFQWSGLGRPSVSSSIGVLEITKFAMTRFRELFSESATLNKLQRVVEKKSVLSSQTTKNGQIYSVYTVPDANMRFVLTAPATNPDHLRMTTCYTA